MFTNSETRTVGDQGPVRLVNPAGRSEILLVCEHASNFFPDHYQGLGLSEDVRQSHVAWDPGAFAVANHLSNLLDAPLVAGGYSRLLYDCNRPPNAKNAMPDKSEIFSVPGNSELGLEDKRSRIDSIYTPFKTRLSSVLDAQNGKSVLVTIHSFTKIYHGRPRQVEIGVLHDADTRLADKLLDIAPSLTDFIVRRNEPYGPDDGVTHTLKLHGVKRGILNVMIEIRNDLISTKQDQVKLAELIATLLKDALKLLPQSDQVRSLQ